MKLQPGLGYTFDSSAKGFTIDTTDPFPNQPAIPNTQFRPYDAGDGKFIVTPGTINGVIPCCDGIDITKLITRIPTPQIAYDWSATVSGYQSCYIYLQASPAAGSDGRTWPAASISDAGYPVIYGYPYTMTDDDATGYLLLALAQKNADTEGITFTQFVTTSVWSERHKYSQPDSAYYYFYRL
jgi:hypothetical protein